MLTLILEPSLKTVNCVRGRSPFHFHALPPQLQVSVPGNVPSDDRHRGTPSMQTLPQPFVQGSGSLCASTATQRPPTF